MSSLQEQLLKAGLVDQSKVRKTNSDKNKQAKAFRKAGSKKVKPVKSPAQLALEKRAEKDRQLNLKRQQEAEKKARTAQIRQLILDNKLDRKKGEIPYSYIFRKKIKKIYVTEEMKNQLVGGRLAIVTFVEQSGRQFEVVPLSVAEKIALRDDQFVIKLQDTAKTEDDAYADYQVPDDLIW